MTALHFAYGANMSRAVMRRYAPDARAIGPATLAGHRFLITSDGYASVQAAPGETVHGVLWKITPRDRVLLDAWENVPGGLYRAETVPVRRKRCLAPALVYYARPSGEGRPKPGYMELVIAAAREWQLPDAYVHDLKAFAPTSSRDRRAQDRGVPVNVARHVVFRGRVQGIGFRAFVERTALGAGLEGWVRNRHVSTVEAVFAGEAATVDAVIEACRKGPRLSHVESVDQREATADEFKLRGGEQFAILPTV